MMQLQKLLYMAPNKTPTPIADLLKRRCKVCKELKYLGEFKAASFAGSSRSLKCSAICKQCHEKTN